MRILHLLQWNIQSIIPRLNEIKEQGFNAIQISPMQGTKEANEEFWVLYQPTNFKVGNTQIGTKEELEELCYKAHQTGLKVVVDVVFRHTANHNVNWLKPNDCIDGELKRDDFFTGAENITDHEDRWQSTNLATQLPMLDYRNYDLQAIYVRYLNELKSCGVDGFRIDMAKHFALPSEDCDFYTNVFKPFEDMIVYGEVLDANKELVDKYSELMLVATNSSGSNKDALVVWSESHDEYLTFGTTKKLTEEYINTEYYRLCYTYKNTLYYVRPFSDGWRSEVVKFANKIMLGE